MALVAFSFGGYFIALSIEEFSLAWRSDAEPKQTSLRKVLEHGRNADPNIILTDFVLCRVYVLDKHGSNISGAWVPIVPCDPDKPNQPDPTDSPVALIRCDADSEKEIKQRCSQSRLRGMVVSPSLDKSIIAKLKEFYPQIDVNSLVVIHEGKEPANVIKLIAYIGGGAIGSLAGVTVIACGFFRRGGKTSLPEQDVRVRELS